MSIYESFTWMVYKLFSVSANETEKDLYKEIFAI